MANDPIPTPQIDRRAGLRADFTAVTRGITKRIQPAQLKAELGADVWTSEGDGGTTVVLANVTQAVLDAAIAAHVADPYYGQPDLKIVADKAATDPAFAALVRILGLCMNRGN